VCFDVRPDQNIVAIRFVLKPADIFLNPFKINDDAWCFHGKGSPFG
jgi:hypothetical protein